MKSSMAGSIDETTRATSARIYDYMIGGNESLHADQMAAERILGTMPACRDIARKNREFVGRAVQTLCDLGVRQFIDLGCGMPGNGDVAEVVTQAAADAKVVSVDVDELVLAYNRALVGGPNRLTLFGDARRPGELLAEPELRAFLNLDEPIALVATALLHFIRDEEDPYGAVAGFREALPAGSYLVVSHGVGGAPLTAEERKRILSIYDKIHSSITVRTPEQVARFFDGFELLEPGVVPAAKWRVDETTGEAAEARGTFVVGVGRRV